MRSREWSSGKRNRPRLLLLVYGATVLLACLTVAAVALLVSHHVETSAVRSIVASDRTIVRDLITGAFRGHDLGNLDGAAAAAASAAMSRAMTTAELSGLRVLSAGGSVVAAADPGELGTAVVASERLNAAFRGHPSAVIEPTHRGLAAGLPVLSEYWPVATSAGVPLVLEVRRDASTIVADAAMAQRDVALVTTLAGLLLAPLLYLMFRGAHFRLNHQAVQLRESTRRDSLTGLLNHGAVVERLSAALEHARTQDSPIGVALVDIDNFRLLNDVHGHAAGDAVLRAVVDAFDQEPGSWGTVGRYGPDEFLVISHPGAARELEPAARRLHGRLENVALRFGRSEPLPVTVSVGIAHFPFHADSVTQLLSEAAIALGEAKASGGDAIRTAGAWEKDPGERTSFDILQGLVFAIDTKDRYTKRHSEDVARYALFLAEQLGLDEKMFETLRLAGLLHDIGKIGIPDDVLRKPGALTPYEYEIVKQHVALGDLIVRDLPNLWLVRAGVRHHHERWDGTGYLTGLAGEKIPLVARILSVGDAFSAMTTTRPYRKALPVKEALKRLEDVAGTQLDPALVSAFVRAIETVPNAPLPGAPLHARLWRPVRATEVLA